MIANHPRETPEATACRGRPRSAAADTAIIETVLWLLEEGATIGEFTMEAIAGHAGVGEATIYRRWPGKDVLMKLLRTLDEPTAELPGRSVPDDLILLVESVRGCGPAKRESAVPRNVGLQFQCAPELWQLYRDSRHPGPPDPGPRGAAARHRHREDPRQRRSGAARRSDRGADAVAHDAPAGLLAGEGLSEQMVDTVLEGVRPRVRPVTTSVPLTSSARQSQNHRQHWRPL
ncbi:MAG TPA: helix-turn-helix domain-containing protein [Streptosporangiaceae bacterium]|nr:helix-turn-helix domain-containing protein [Streptosporangiaceae bacterium]